MTEELLSEVIAKMNEACEGKVEFGYNTDSCRQWWIHRIRSVEESSRLGYHLPTAVNYSPTLSICQLVDWCEAWLRGAEEIRAIFAKNING